MRSLRVLYELHIPKGLVVVVAALAAWLILAVAFLVGIAIVAQIGGAA